MEDAIKNYLDIINMISKEKDLYTISVLNQERGRRHFTLLKNLRKYYKEIFEINEIIEGRLQLITNRLDNAIGFNPPLKKYDNLKLYSIGLYRLLSCAECRNFLSRSTSYILNTNYGQIK